MVNHPFNQTGCILRLRKEFKQYNKLYIGFDFDNTIFDYHNTGGSFKTVIQLLKDCSKLGHCMILCTCETNPDKLAWKIKYCEHFGIHVNHVNENPDILPGSHKPYYSILLDDRAGLEETVKILKEVIYGDIKPCNSSEKSN